MQANQKVIFETHDGMSVPTRLIALKAENFRRLEAVAISFPNDKRLLTISGPNDAGKSSVLDAVFAGLGGAPATHSDPIHWGAKAAKLTLKLEGGINAVVRRTIRPTGHELAITPSDGEPVKSPQTLLDSLWNPITADPLAMDRLNETPKGRKEYREILLKVAKIDSSEIDARRKKLYDKRTLVNHERDGIQKILKDMLAVDEAQTEQVNVSALTAKIVEAERRNTGRDALVSDLAEAENAVDKAEKSLREAQANATSATAKCAGQDKSISLAKGSMITEDMPLSPLEAEVERLQKELAAVQKRYNDAAKQNEANAEAKRKVAEMESAQAVLAEKVKAAGSKVNELNQVVVEAEEERTRLHSKLMGVSAVDVESLRAKLKDAAKLNENVRLAANKRTHKAEFKSRCDLSDALTAELKAIDQEILDKLAAAKFPVPGLGVDDDGPTLHGHPVSSQGSAMRYRVAVAVGLALSPGIRVLLIRDGSLLDSKAKVELVKILDEYDAYCLSEVVDETGKVGIVINDGAVVAVNE